MLPPLFSFLGISFDGHWFNIITHPGAVIFLAYGVPLAIIAVLTKGFGVPIPFTAKPIAALQWVLSADPGTAAQIEQRATQTEQKMADGFARIEAQIQALTAAIPKPPASA